MLLLLFFLVFNMLSYLVELLVITLLGLNVSYVSFSILLIRLINRVNRKILTLLMSSPDYFRSFPLRLFSIFLPNSILASSVEYIQEIEPTIFSSFGTLTLVSFLIFGYVWHQIIPHMGPHRAYASLLE